MSDKNYSELLNAMKSYFEQGSTLPIATRRSALLRLKRTLMRNEQALYDAISLDFGRCSFDSWSCEYLMIQEEISVAIHSLERWTAMRYVNVGIVNAPSRAGIRPEPLGTVLILSPWNYPAALALSPLIGAVGAGNCAVLKPSSNTPHTSELLKRIVEESFDQHHVAVILGDHSVSDALQNERFDLIFFTGSPAVGKRVMQAAAKHLTPVILELGGKSPCIVDETAVLTKTAQRIMWGKFLNAGQTCVAPDYLLVQRKIAPKLISELKRQIKRHYYHKGTLTNQWPQIITQQHTERLTSLLKGENIVFGGRFDLHRRIIEPTLLYPVSPDSPCMKQELFGPILPILVYDSLDDAIRFIRKREKPLALYHFSTSRKAVSKVLALTSAGGGCVNDTIMHVSSANLPFGGVGMSGMGRYHGKASFNAFSNPRTVVIKSPWLELPLRYPPHHPNKLFFARKLFSVIFSLQN